MSTKKTSNFGTSVSNSLAGVRMTQSELAEKLGTSQSYVSQKLSGTRPATPRWADLIADVLGLPEEERVKLHRAAALDRGYKLDLTKK